MMILIKQENLDQAAEEEDPKKMIRRQVKKLIIKVYTKALVNGTEQKQVKSSGIKFDVKKALPYEKT